MTKINIKPSKEAYIAAEVDSCKHFSDSTEEKIKWAEEEYARNPTKHDRVASFIEVTSNRGGRVKTCLKEI